MKDNIYVKAGGQCYYEDDEKVEVVMSMLELPVVHTARKAHTPDRRLTTPGFSISNRTAGDLLTAVGDLKILQ